LSAKEWPAGKNSLYNQSHLSRPAGQRREGFSAAKIRVFQKRRI
jgi:hypothetical protein